MKNQTQTEPKNKSDRLDTESDRDREKLPIK